MAWYDVFADIGRGFVKFWKAVGKALWSTLKTVFKGIFKFLKEFVVLGVYNLLACLIGVVGGALVAAITKLGNLGGKRPLTERERRIVEDFFPSIDFGEVRVRPNSSPLPVPDDLQALTIGSTIYHKTDFKECDLTDMTWLVHELVHVNQFRKATLGLFEISCEYGLGYSKTWDYERNPVEREAFRFTESNEDLIEHKVREVCLFYARRGEDWHRLLLDAP